MQKYVVLEKQVGETPLQCAEAWRAAQPPAFANVPLAYAGRLDPMASGKLLILIGEECKRQQKYHGLDKEYQFEVLFGVQSDSGDVLGLVASSSRPGLSVRDLEKRLHATCGDFQGQVTFPYPKFSSKTVHGKPLHTWTLEGRLHEIAIPTYTSTVYSLRLNKIRTLTGAEVCATASEKIESIPPVTDDRKALGNDFRRTDVRASWKQLNDEHATDTFAVATFSCTCSSGTYMRTLAEEIAARLGTVGLAFSIHRSVIGTYQPLPLGFGFWRKTF